MPSIKTEVRHAIKAYVLDGCGSITIQHKLRNNYNETVSLSQIKRIAQKVRLGVSLEPPRRGGRPRTVRTLDNIAVIGAIALTHDDQTGQPTSSRKIEKEGHVLASRSSIQRMMKEDLGLRTPKCVHTNKNISGKANGCCLKQEQQQQLAQQQYPSLTTTTTQQPKPPNKKTKKEKNDPNTERKRQKKDPKLPKRALSAFFFFSIDRRPMVQQAQPDWRIGQVAQELGRLWKEISPMEKQRYDDMANRERARFDMEMQEYTGVVACSTQQSIDQQQQPVQQQLQPNNQMVSNGQLLGSSVANIVDAMFDTGVVQPPPPPSQPIPTTSQQQQQQQHAMQFQQQNGGGMIGQLELQQLHVQQQHQHQQQQPHYMGQQQQQQMGFEQQMVQQQQMNEIQPQMQIPVNAAQFVAAVQNLGEQQLLMLH